MHFITWLQNSCTAHTTRPDLWFVTFPAVDAEDSTQSLPPITSWSPIHHHITQPYSKEWKTTHYYPYTHTPMSATQNTNTLTGPCSHRAQCQFESPFTHGLCNTQGLTLLKKVRDPTCSPSTELLDHTEQVWGCCTLHLKDCSESETVSDNTRYSSTIVISNWAPFHEVTNARCAFVIIRVLLSEHMQLTEDFLPEQLTVFTLRCSSEIKKKDEVGWDVFLGFFAEKCPKMSVNSTDVMVV